MSMGGIPTLPLSAILRGMSFVVSIVASITLSKKLIFVD